MSETVFVTVRNDKGSTYESYFDYWKIIGLSGYKTCDLGEIDFQSDSTYVYSPANGNTFACFTQDKAKSRRCKVVLWQLEWARWENGVLKGLEVPDYVDEMWISDLAYCDLARTWNPGKESRIRYVFMGGHPAYGNPNYATREIKHDFCHLSYVWGVREHKMRILHDRGFTFADDGNCWGEARERALRTSRWGLQLHQRPLPYMAPQRLLIFASYGLPIITDPLIEPYPYRVFQDGLIHWDPRETSVSNPGFTKEAVDYNYLVVTKMKTFRKEVDGAVS